MSYFRHTPSGAGSPTSSTARAHDAVLSGGLEPYTLKCRRAADVLRSLVMQCHSLGMHVECGVMTWGRQRTTWTRPITCNISVTTGNMSNGNRSHVYRSLPALLPMELPFQQSGNGNGRKSNASATSGSEIPLNFAERVFIQALRCNVK